MAHGVDRRIEGRQTVKSDRKLNTWFTARLIALC